MGGKDLNGSQALLNLGVGHRGQVILASEGVDPKPLIQEGGKTVGELDIRRKYDINILAIKNNGELSMAISPDTFFTGNISLLVIGEHKAIKKCFHI